MKMQFIRKLFHTISLIALILSIEVSSLNLRNKYHKAGNSNSMDMIAQIQSKTQSI